MLTGFDLLVHSRRLQVYWLRRWAAFVVDLVVVLLPVLAVLTVLGANDSVILAGLYSGLFLFTYSAVLEMHWGRTLGKALLDLRVDSFDGTTTPRGIVVRNADRFFWYLLPLIDFLLGLATEGDPRQRLTERVLGYVVYQASATSAPVPFAVAAAEFEHAPAIKGLDCRECGGSMSDVGDGALQCARCGRIQ